MHAAVTKAVESRHGATSHCPKGHVLITLTTDAEARVCDMCSVRSQEPGRWGFAGCALCQFDLCPSCLDAEMSLREVGSSPSLRASVRLKDVDLGLVTVRLEPGRVSGIVFGRVLKDSANRYSQVPDELVFTVRVDGVCVDVSDETGVISLTAKELAVSLSCKSRFSASQLAGHLGVSPGRFNSESAQGVAESAKGAEGCEGKVAKSSAAKFVRKGPKGCSVAESRQVGPGDWQAELLVRVHQTKVRVDADLIFQQQRQRVKNSLGVATCTGQVLLAVLSGFAEYPCLGTRSQTAAEFDWISFGQLGERIKVVAARVQSHLAPDSRAGICGANSIDWVVVDWACILVGVTVIPLHPLLGSEVIGAIIEETGMELGFHDAQFTTHAWVERLRWAVPIDPLVLDMLSCVEALPSLPALRSPESTVSILYTSGTTGRPKGALVPDRAWCGLFSRAMESQDAGSVFPVDASFALSSPRTTAFEVLCSGGRVGLVRPGLGKWLEGDLRCLRPTALVDPPTVLEALRKHFQDEAGTEQQQLSECRALSGGSLRRLTTGGAVPGPSLIAWLRRVFGPELVHNSYGACETGTIAEDGRVLPGVQIKLEDWGGYSSADVPHARGELCVKTDELISGYTGVQQPATDDEGFFHTGDIVEMQATGGTMAGQSFDPAVAWAYELHVIDRKNSMVKLAHGEWICPSELEAAFLAECAGIRQIYVHGVPGASCVSAVVVPTSALATGTDPENTMREELAEAGRRRQLRPSDIPQTIVFTPEAFSEMNGLMTASGKLARRAVAERFHAQLRLERCEKPVHLRLLERLEELRGGAQELSRDHLPLKCLGCDSASLLLLLGLIRSKYAETLAPASADSLLSLRDALRSHTGASQGSKCSNELFWVAEVDRAVASCQRVFSSITQPTPSRSSATPVVLLTGARGFVGSALLRQLLCTSGIRVRCLGRCGVWDELAPVLRRRGYLPEDENEVSAWRSRVEIVRGDLCQRHFGLPAEEVRALLRNVKAVVHCAARVTLADDYEGLKQVNVEATMELLGLSAGSGAAFHFVSSMGIFGDGDVRESAEPAPPLSSRGCSGYDQSKWVADQAVLNAGLRCEGAVRVYRLPLISGDASTGSWNASDWLPRFLLGCLELGAVPRVTSAASVEHCPVDVAACAVAACCLTELAGGSIPPRVFHLPTISTSYARLLELWGAELGVRCETVELREWAQRLLASPSDNPLAPLAYMYAESPPENSRRVAAPGTTQHLRTLGLELCSEVADSSVRGWARWLSQGEDGET